MLCLFRHAALSLFFFALILFNGALFFVCDLHFLSASASCAGVSFLLCLLCIRNLFWQRRVTWRNPFSAAGARSFHPASSHNIEVPGVIARIINRRFATNSPHPSIPPARPHRIAGAAKSSQAPPPNLSLS